MRLVTTNFDTFFEKARRTVSLQLNSNAAPVVPIPRNDRVGSWRSLVYLHGRLSEATAQSLVLTSADFGRAYLTEGWAARFVARLFSDFTVLFIGYSLNDPVLRYMTDAFAAEDAEARFGQPRGPAYIFTSFDGEAPPDARPYKNRNLEPIFYRSAEKHISLKETLIKWADARDDYLASATVLINTIAPTRPDSINPTDTANLVWAVIGRPTDNGHGADVFSSVTENPPIQWLDEFERHEREVQEHHIAACKDARKGERQSPPEPQLNVVPLFPDVLDARVLRLSRISHGLINWLVRHLDSQELVERIIAKLKEGRRPHAFLRERIRQRLDGDHGLPAGYAQFWRIVAAEGEWAIWDRSAHRGLGWAVREALGTNADPAWLKQEIISALRPVLGLTPSYYLRWHQAAGSISGEEIDGSRLAHVADAEVHLAAGDQVGTIVANVNVRPDAEAFWAEMLDDLVMLLRHALNLHAIADEASAESDPSSFQRPSIVPHVQNSGHDSWTVLFDLIWRSWVHIDATNGQRSRAIVKYWQSIPYLAFRRLALAAIAQSPHFSAEERKEALLDG